MIRDIKPSPKIHLFTALRRNERHPAPHWRSTSWSHRQRATVSARRTPETRRSGCGRRGRELPRRTGRRLRPRAACCFPLSRRVGRQKLDLEGVVVEVVDRGPGAGHGPHDRQLGLGGAEPGLFGPVIRGGLGVGGGRRR